MKGFDTETVNRPGHGYACLLVDSDGRTRDFPDSLPEIFEWVQDGDHVAWNADFDIRAVIHERFVPFDVMEELAVTNHSKLDKVKIEYIPRKRLVLSDGNKRFRLFDLQQFYGGTLKAAAEKFLPGQAGKGDLPKDWYTEIDKCLRDERRAQVLAYAVQDAALLPKLFEPLRAGYERLGIVPKSWTSPASLAAIAFKRDLDKLRPLPQNVQEFFRKAFFGGRIEVGGLGAPPIPFEPTPEGSRPGKLTLYDINSAYPAAAANLKDPSRCLLVKVGPGGEEPQPDGALYGAYSVRVSVPKDWKWGPVAVRQGGDVSYPVGDVRTHCGREAILAMRAAGLDPIIDQGWEFWPQEAEPAPLFPDIPRLYDSRRDPLLKTPSKLTLNSLYGKLCETREKYVQADAFDWYRSQWFSRVRVRSYTVYGKYCYFPVSAAITENVRMRLWNVARTMPTYMMMTDSVLVRGSVDNGDKLGDWGKKGDVVEAVIYGAGRYYLKMAELNDKGENKEVFHLRGFAPKPENLRRLRLARTRTCALTDFRTGGFQGWVKGGGLEDFNVLADVEMIYTPDDRKRYYPERPARICDLGEKWYDSAAWISRQRVESGKR